MKSTIKKLSFFKWNKGLYLRDYWVCKHMKVLKQNPRAYIDIEWCDEAGAGMRHRHAIREYLNATGVAYELKVNDKWNQFLTPDFGEIIYKYDRYTEDSFTTWLFHYQMIKNSHISTIWSIFFNYVKGSTFTQDDLEKQIIKILNSEYRKESYSKKNLKEDIELLIRSYHNPNTNLTPEENPFSAFESMNLLSVINSYNGDVVITRNKPNFKNINPLLAMYVLLDNVEQKEHDYLTFGEILNDVNNLGKVFCFTESVLYDYLSKLIHEGLIKVDSSEGERRIYFSEISKKEILEMYYKRHSI